MICNFRLQISRNIFSMYLDPRTVGIINIFSAGLFGIALLAVSQGYLKQIRGIYRWAIASLIHSLAWILYSLRGVVPDAISILLALTFLLLSLASYFKIIVEFKNKSKYTDWVYYLIVVSVAGLAYFLWIKPDTAIRIVIISASSATLLFAGFYVLLSGKEKRPTSHTFTGLVLAFSAGILFFRAVYYLIWDTDPNQTVFVQNTMQSITFLTSYLTAAILTFGFLLMGYDQYITQHEQAEEKIIQSEKSLNEAQKLAKVGSWGFDLDTNELTWSKEQYHIFELPETAPDKLYELCRTKIHPDDIPQLDEAIRRGKEKGEGVVYEHRVLCKDGSVKHLLGMGETFKGGDGKKNMLRGTVQDITERKKAEETSRKFAILESKSKEMEQFAYIASHDLREPLLSIKNYVELFAEEYQGKLDADSDEYLHRISRATNRMDELIKGLLDYSRLSKVKELQQVDCNEVMNAALADIHSLIQNNDAKIIIEKLPVLLAYPLELKQLFQNLLTNAIKFKKCEAIPEIYISAERKNGVWLFKFADNGIGVEKTDKDKIFGLFQRVHNRSEYEGSGIGLAYCKKIVELHHGNIWVDSTFGKGSSFYFTIATD